MKTFSHRFFRHALVVVSILGAFPCQGGDPVKSAAAPSATVTPAAAVSKIDIPTTGVRSITLPTFDMPAMPSGPGQATFMSACMLCHSPRYVLMQPPFPKKTWVAEVDKMKKVYGAPILDEQVEPLVNYLVAIRGNGQ